MTTTTLHLDILDPAHDSVVSRYEMTQKTQQILEQQFGFLPEARLPQEALSTNWNPLATIEVLQGLIHQVNLKSILPNKKLGDLTTKRWIDVTPDERKAMVSHRDFSRDNEEWIEFQIGFSTIDPVLATVEQELKQFVAFLQSLTPGLVLRNFAFETPAAVDPTPATLAAAETEEAALVPTPPTAAVAVAAEHDPTATSVEETAPIE